MVVGLKRVKDTADNRLPKLVVRSDELLNRDAPIGFESLLFPSGVTVCHTDAHIYHGWREISCSQLKCLSDSPKTFYHKYEDGTDGQKSSTNESLAYGTLFHEWGELQEAFWPRLYIAPASICTGTGAISKAKSKGWFDDLPEGSFPCSPADAEKLKAQTRNLLANADVRSLLEERQDAEFNVRWQWKGHDVRSRVDGSTSTHFYDWKTTREPDPTPYNWYRTVLKFNYHLQAAMYGNAQQAMFGFERRMRFIVISTTFPYECCVVKLPHRLIQQGRDECLRLLDELASRRAWNYWDRLSTGVQELYVPEYVYKKGN